MNDIYRLTYNKWKIYITTDYQGLALNTLYNQLFAVDVFNIIQEKDNEDMYMEFIPILNLHRS